MARLDEPARVPAPGMDDPLTEALLRAGRHLRSGEVSDDLRTLTKSGGRQADSFYRDRWSDDKVVRSTHGVNWTVLIDDGSGAPAVPNGSLAFRFGQAGAGRWNLDLGEVRLAWLLFAAWPFTRLVHVFSAPLGYLTRPYIVYRSPDVAGARTPRRGWEPIGSPPANRR